MKIKVMDSIEYIDSIFKKGISDYSLEDLKKDFLMHIQGKSYTNKLFPDIDDNLLDSLIPSCVGLEAEERKKELFGHLPVRDSLIQILKYALVKSCDEEITPEVDFFKEIKETIFCDGLYADEKDIPYSKDSDKGKSRSLSIMMDFLKHEDLVTQLLNAFVDCRYRGLEETGIITDEYDPEKEINDPLLKELIGYLKPVGTISDMGQLFTDKISHFFQRKSINMQTKFTKRTYNQGKDLLAMFRQRTNEQHPTEGVLLSHHPFNKDFKLFAVAETDLGKDKGASLVLNRINEWFFNLDPKYYQDIDSLNILFKNFLQSINCEFKGDFKLSETSLSVAFVTQNNTLLFSLGLIPCILLKNGTISRIKVDGVRLGTDTFMDNIEKGSKIIDNDYDKLILLNREAKYWLSGHFESIRESKGLVKKLKNSPTSNPLAIAIHSKGCN